MSLIASRTKRVGEEAVRAIAEPLFTQTWHPVGHWRVIEALGEACADLGADVLKKSYSLNESGTQMFGSWTLEIGRADVGWAVGFRNAIDKSRALGICGGNEVFVCDNLAFSAKWIAFRKHTGGLTQDVLETLTKEAMSDGLNEADKLIAQQDKWKELYVNKDERKLLTYEAMQNKIVNPSDFWNLQKAHEEEVELTHGFPSLYAFSGSISRLYRHESLFQIGKRTSKIEELAAWYIQRRVEQGPELPKDFIDGDVITLN